MYEFDSVSVSTYEAASLAAKLSEKSADGWEVVAIVPAGSDITAFVKRAASADAAVTTAVVDEPAPSVESAPTEVSEPSGWGTAPAATAGESTWGQTSAADTGSSWGAASSGTTDTSSGWGGAGTTTTPATTATTPAGPAQPATPSVPAGWYHDPAGRFELRYWDGSAWTEHVSRNGQQYTDPPVA